ncbi:3-hydroxyacyl-CoA dehydrogenase NAD-binding domain-containing protein [Segnochrobactraceae bacterium EtOH-i3]
MMAAIQKAAVIGAGTMGSGIAAHLANAGVEVVLLDLDAKVAAGGVERQIKAHGFMDPAFASRITTGSTVTDLALVEGADWIIEAVAERLDIKQALYAALETHRKPGAAVSSNTSTIPLAHLIEGRSDDFAAHFLITHFFNPPRHMRLLEIVTGPKTEAATARKIEDFADIHLGKGVVLCRDTPGFIANRIGCYWMAAGINEAIRLGITVEEADAVIGKPFAIPATGIFSLTDLVGVDLMPYVLRSQQESLPADDGIQSYAAEPAVMTKMIAAGHLGRKAGAGFVRVSADRKSRDVIDLSTGDYRPQQKVASESLEASKGDARALLVHPGLGGRYALAVMANTLAYAALHAPGIAASPADVDTAMRLGYGWGVGPFELIDRLGAKWFADLLAQKGFAVPPLLTEAVAAGSFYKVVDGVRSVLMPGTGAHAAVKLPEGVISLPAIDLKRPPVMAEEAAELIDLGDGIACFSLKTKMNTFGHAPFAALLKALELTARNFRGLVIGTEGAVFSAGADLRAVLAMSEAGDLAGITAFIDAGHHAFDALKYAPFPVVSAHGGLALGGGSEVMLHSDGIRAFSEATMGLVETRVGLIPAWGGCKELLARFAAADPARSPAATAKAVFEVIFPARTSMTAFDARRLGFLRPADGISMNRDRLIADAKADAIALSDGYAAPEKAAFALSGPAGLAAIRNVIDAAAETGKLTEHDRVIAEALAGVLTGGAGADPARPVSEDTVEALERAAFLDLVVRDPSRDRMRTMITTGKPLRN